MTTLVSAANGDALSTDAQRSTRSKFFFGMSVVMLVIVFIGFTPSFFLHTAFGRPNLPVYLHAHGTALTGWYAWFALQAFCVAAGRTDLHRLSSALPSPSESWPQQHGRRCISGRG